MALQKQKLEGKCIDISRQPGEARVTAQLWASAYASYAADASHAAGPPNALSLKAAQKKLEAQLVIAFLTSKDPVSSAALLSVAFSAFWLLPPILFGATGVTTVALSPTLQVALLALFTSGPAPSAEIAGRKLASVLDAWSRTVLVLFPPAPTPTPIT